MPAFMSISSCMGRLWPAVKVNAVVRGGTMATGSAAMGIGGGVGPSDGCLDRASDCDLEVVVSGLVLLRMAAGDAALVVLSASALSSSLSFEDVPVISILSMTQFLILCPSPSVKPIFSLSKNARRSSRAS